MTFQQAKSCKGMIEAVDASLTDQFDTPSIALGNYDIHPTYISYDGKN